MKIVIVVTAEEPEFATLRKVLNLPFVPVKGMELQVTPKGDSSLVAGVFWTARRPDEIEVRVESYGRPWPVPDLLREGWEIELDTHRDGTAE